MLVLICQILFDSHYIEKSLGIIQCLLLKLGGKGDKEAKAFRQEQQTSEKVYWSYKRTSPAKTGGKGVAHTS